VFYSVLLLGLAVVVVEGPRVSGKLARNTRSWLFLGCASVSVLLALLALVCTWSLEATNKAVVDVRKRGVFVVALAGNPDAFNDAVRQRAARCAKPFRKIEPFSANDRRTKRR